MTTFTFNNHTYEIVTSAKTWQEAKVHAESVGGYLAVVSSQEENNRILSEAIKYLDSAPMAQDGGGARYLWLGATDMETEGTWKWLDGTSVPAGFSPWGSGSLGSEPDDFEGQDALALGLEAWPTNGGGIGTAGKWNDLDQQNQLIYIIESEPITTPQPLTGSALIAKIKAKYSLPLSGPVERAYAAKIQQIIDANPSATDTDLDSLLVNGVLRLTLIRNAIAKSVDKNGDGKIGTLAELTAAKTDIDSTVDALQAELVGTQNPSNLEALASNFSKINAGTGSFLSPDTDSVLALSSGDVWTANSLSYSFNTSTPSEYKGITVNSTPSGTLTSGWSSMNEVEKNAVRQAISGFSSITPIIFHEVQGNTGDIRFNILPTNQGIGGFAYPPAANWSPGGDVFISDKDRTVANYVEGKQAYTTIWHEIGHAMGLKHPFDIPNTLPSDQDNWTNTIMSYTPGRSLLLEFTHSGGQVGYQAEYEAVPSSYSLLDVAALQAMYGINSGYRTGADSYSISFSQHRYLTIWDAGGNDTIDCSSAEGNCTVDLRPGRFSSLDVHDISTQQLEAIAQYHAKGITWADSWVEESYANPDIANKLYTGENNLAIAHGVWLENISTGSANDSIRDNETNNNIATGAGDDLIKLFDGGYDIVDGGTGTDTVEIINTRSQVQIEKQSDGSQLLVGSYFGAKLVGVEYLLFSNGETMSIS